MEYKYSLNELLTILPLLKMIFPKNHDPKCLNKEGLEILRSHFNALFDSDEIRTEFWGQGNRQQFIKPKRYNK